MNAPASGAEARDGGARATLPAAQGGGSELCLDPESPTLRRAVAQRWQKDSPVDALDLVADLDDFHGVLRKQYAGYPEMLHQRGFDPAGFFAKWQADLRAGPRATTFEAAVLRPMLALRRSFFDQHLSLGGAPNGFSELRTVIYREFQAPVPAQGIRNLAACDPGENASPTTLRLVRALRGEGVERRVTVSAMSAMETTTLDCPEGPITLHRRTRSRFRDTGPAYEWRERGDVGIIRVRRLSGPPEDVATLAQLAKDYERHRRKRLLVFDFRGNHGGDDAPVFDWISLAARGEWRIEAGTLSIRGAFEPCSTWNQRVFQQVEDGTVDRPEARAEREALRARWSPRPLPSRDVLETGAKVARGTRPYRGRIVALVDAGAVSSGESAPAGLRSALGALVVGERSGGFQEYGEVRPFVLARTGLVAWIPTARYFYEEPREGVGIPVDAYLDDLDRPVEELLPRIRARLADGKR